MMDDLKEAVDLMENIEPVEEETTEDSSPESEETSVEESTESSEKTVKTPEEEETQAESLAPKSENRFQQQANRIRELEQEVSKYKSDSPQVDQAKQALNQHEDYIKRYEDYYRQNPSAQMDPSAAAQYAVSMAETLKLQNMIQKESQEFHSRMNQIAEIERSYPEFDKANKGAFDSDLLAKFHALTVKNNLDPQEAAELVLGSYKKGQSIGSVKERTQIADKQSGNKIESAPAKSKGVNFDNMKADEMLDYLRAHPELL